MPTRGTPRPWRDSTFTSSESHPTRGRRALALADTRGPRDVGGKTRSCPTYCFLRSLRCFFNYIPLNFTNFLIFIVLALFIFIYFLLFRFYFTYSTSLFYLIISFHIHFGLLLLFHYLISFILLCFYILYYFILFYSFYLIDSFHLCLLSYFTLFVVEGKTFSSYSKVYVFSCL